MTDEEILQQARATFAGLLTPGPPYYVEITAGEIREGVVGEYSVGVQNLSVSLVGQWPIARLSLCITEPVASQAIAQDGAANAASPKPTTIDSPGLVLNPRQLSTEARAVRLGVYQRIQRYLVHFASRPLYGTFKAVWQQGLLSALLDTKGQAALSVYQLVVLAEGLPDMNLLWCLTGKGGARLGDTKDSYHMVYRPLLNQLLGAPPQGPPPAEGQSLMEQEDRRMQVVIEEVRAVLSVLIQPPNPVFFATPTPVPETEGAAVIA